MGVVLWIVSLFLTDEASMPVGSDFCSRLDYRNTLFNSLFLTLFFGNCNVLKRFPKVTNSSVTTRENSRS